MIGPPGIVETLAVFGLILIVVSAIKRVGKGVFLGGVLCLPLIFSIVRGITRNLM